MKYLFILLAFLLFLSCTTAPVSSTETETGQIAGTVKDKNDDVAPGAEIILRDKDEILDYISKSISVLTGSRRDTTVTDNKGKFQFDSIYPGRYYIEVNYQDTLGSLIETELPKKDTMIQADASVKGMGVIEGRIDTSVIKDFQASRIFVAEVERKVAVNSSGMFTINRLPIWGYNLRLLLNDSIIDSPLDTMTVPVTENDTTIIQVGGDKDSIPTITVDLSSTREVNEGDSVTLFIFATGGNLTYQWQNNNTNISNTDDSVYTLDSVSMDDTGSYRCIVTNSLGSDTSSSLKLTIRQPVPINFDSVVTDSIITEDDIDYYLFSGTAGDKITIRMDPDGIYFASTVQLIAPGDSIVSQTTATNGYPNIVNDVELPATGTYTIAISETNGGNTCNYSLAVYSRQFILNNSPSISFDTTITDSIPTSVEMNHYLLSGIAGDKISIRLDPSGIYFGSTVQLIDANDSIVSQTTATNGDPNIVNDVELPATGMYTISIFETNAGADCNYSLVLYSHLDIINNSPTIGFDTTVEGSIPYDINMAHYLLTGNAGDRISIRFDPSGIYYNSTVQLIDANDSIVSQMTATDGGPNIANDIELPTTGTYLISIFETNASTHCDYSLVIYSHEDIINNSPTIGFDTTVEGSIPYDINMAHYLLTGNAGDRISIRFDPSGIYYNSTVQLIDANDSIVSQMTATDGGPNIANDIELPTTGTYLISIFETNASTHCDYSLVIYSHEDIINNSPTIGFDTTVEGSIPYDINMAHYLFSGIAGDTITIQFDPSGIYFGSTIQLVAPNDSIVSQTTATNGDPNIVDNIVLPVTGSYLIAIFETEADATCNYTLELTKAIKNIQY